MKLKEGENSNSVVVTWGGGKGRNRVGVLHRERRRRGLASMAKQVYSVAFRPPFCFQNPSRATATLQPLE